MDKKKKEIKSTNNSKIFYLNRYVVEHPELTNFEKVIYFGLGTYNGKGKIFPKLTELAKRINSRDTSGVSKGLKHLKELGIINIEKRKQRSNIYSFNYDILDLEDINKNKSEIKRQNNENIKVKRLNERLYEDCIKITSEDDEGLEKELSNKTNFYENIIDVKDYTLEHYYHDMYSPRPKSANEPVEFINSAFSDIDFFINRFCTINNCDDEKAWEYYRKFNSWKDGKVKMIDSQWEKQFSKWYNNDYKENNKRIEDEIEDLYIEEEKQDVKKRPFPKKMLRLTGYSDDLEKKKENLINEEKPKILTKEVREEGFERIFGVKNIEEYRKQEQEEKIEKEKERNNTNNEINEKAKMKRLRERTNKFRLFLNRVE